MLPPYQTHRSCGLSQTDTQDITSHGLNVFYHERRIRVPYRKAEMLANKQDNLWASSQNIIGPLQLIHCLSHHCCFFVLRAENF